MPKVFKSLEEALKNFKREDCMPAVAAAENERNAMLERFPLDLWPQMTLEMYAIGQPGSENTFCRWLEFKTKNLGGIRGGSARKLIIYKHRDKPGWYFHHSFKNEQEAWAAVKEAFVQAFKLAKGGQFNRIDDLEALHGGPALLLKTLCLYFPEDFIPIYTKAHIQHFLNLLQPETEVRETGVVRLNRMLLAELRQRPEFNGWSDIEVMRFLYYWADPRARRIVKIAPGENAQFWPDCLANGYICVGWDEIGDLREFESKEAFRQRFIEVYSSDYNHHKPTITKKVNELWTLMELEPGDLVVANQGTGKVLAIGEVVEPYEWLQEREKYAHVVHVRWDTSYEQDIESQKNWAFLTIAPVSYSLYERIIRKTQKEKEDEGVPPAPDPLWLEIAQALERKGQVILYGPPGTGKTYHARRFALWWLLTHQGDPNPLAALANSHSFEAAERRLSTVQLGGRVWWVVANSKEWNWEQLFKKGSERFRYGRLKRNYSLIQPGDLVIGYQAAPEKRIMALAKISKGLDFSDAENPYIELKPVTRIKDGLSYEDLLKDPILSLAEPMAFRNQGTLFGLTPEQSGHLMARLAERNPEIADHLETEESIGQLTRLTFHPSYSYEDFIEGFRPVDTGSGSLVLKLEDGVYKRICREALANPRKKFLVLIDEINRANIAKVFGEMVTLLEKDKRGLIITLPQSKQSFTIPPNVYLLGTMNTADRSIKLLDAAIRRRFAFLELMPDLTLLRGARVGSLPLDDFLQELNRRISKREGREKQIGHSFLLENGEPVSDPESLARCFRQEILPLLQEYCYDDYSALGEYLGGKLINGEAQTIDLEVITQPELLLEALEEEFIRSGDLNE
ncbi:MAG: AAA family ATPase [Bacillota bacterium]